MEKNEAINLASRGPNDATGCHSKDTRDLSRASRLRNLAQHCGEPALGRISSGARNRSQLRRVMNGWINNSLIQMLAQDLSSTNTQVVITDGRIGQNQRGDHPRRGYSQIRT